MLLRIIASHNRAGLRVVDLCRLTELQRPTVHRLLQCLIKEALVARNLRTRNYHLGPLLYELGITASPAVKLEDLCRPFITKLAEITGDMVFLTLRSGYDAVCIDKQQGKFLTRTHMEVGRRRPLGIGAGSLAILGAIHPDDAKDVLAKNRTRWRAFNELTARKMLKQLKETRERGFAVHDGSVSGARAIGIALKDAHGVPFAGLSVYAIVGRMQESRWPELTKAMRQQAVAIEAAVRKNGKEGPGSVRP